MRRDRRFELVLSEEELTTWRELAEAEGLSLAAWMRRCCKEVVDVLETIRRNEARERQTAARLHAMDPLEARRRDFGRGGELDDVHTEGGTRP